MAMTKTKISWSQRTWNAVHGCSKVSDGCKSCYAMTLSLKNGWTKKPWTIQNEAENVILKPHKLHEPYTLDEPQRVFVNSMSDMFHRVIPDWYIAAMWCVMLDLPQHVFQILTKRPERTADWPERFIAAVQTQEFKDFVAQAKNKKLKAALEKASSYSIEDVWADHIWMGTSVEDGRVIGRIEHLRQCGAKVKFLSSEPLIGAYPEQVDLSGLNWIIVGGESGNGYRPMDQAWARHIRDLCVAQGVAFFYKQDSGYRTELRPWLVEEDGSFWRWHQYPGDMAVPVLLDKHGDPILPSDLEEDIIMVAVPDEIPAGGNPAEPEVLRIAVPDDQMFRKAPQQPRPIEDYIGEQIKLF